MATTSGRSCLFRSATLVSEFTVMLLEQHPQCFPQKVHESLRDTSRPSFRRAVTHAHLSQLESVVCYILMK